MSANTAELEARFSAGSRAIVNQMRRINGGNSNLPRRDRPEVDFTEVFRTNDGLVSVELYSCGMWGSFNGETWDPIGLVEDVEARHMLPHYAILKEDALATAIGATKIPLEQFSDETLSFEDRQAVYTKKIEPIIDRYVKDNQERLLVGLVGNVREALGRTLNGYRAKYPNSVLYK
jgi:hypothetical protein